MEPGYGMEGADLEVPYSTAKLRMPLMAIFG
jgi:hypothetical protein